MSKPRPNLVAGRLSLPLSASGKSTYEKTRMGLALSGQVLDSLDELADGTPPVDTQPVDAPVSTPTQDAPATFDAPPGVFDTPGEPASSSEAVSVPDVAAAPPDQPFATPALWEMSEDNLTLVAPPTAELSAQDDTAQADMPWAVDATAVVNAISAPAVPPELVAAEAMAPVATVEVTPADTLAVAQAADMVASAMAAAQASESADAIPSAPLPWEMPAPQTTDAPLSAPVPVSDATPPVATPAASAESASLAEQVRAQAIQAWNAQQQPSSDWELTAPAPPKRSVKVLRVLKIASPALGGLTLLLVIMYGLWTWVNDGTAPSTPALANGATANTAGNTVSNGATRGTIDLPKPPVEPNEDEWIKVVNPDGTVTFMKKGEIIDPPIEPPVDPPTVPPTIPVPQPPTFTLIEAPPNFRLVSIVTRDSRPAAYMNSRHVYVGDKIAGAKVVAIGRFTVEMEITDEEGHKRFTLTLAGSGEEPDPPPPPPAPAETSTPAPPPTVAPAAGSTPET